MCSSDLEALASIAAIAQLELKTKKVEDELGTLIVIEGSEVKSQEPCACANGTLLSVKNLFYNIPARRKFLKSTHTELRHIIEEFNRVVLVNPGIRFSFINENRQLFLLNKSNLKQRIVALFGSAYNTRLVPVEADSIIVRISGFIGKPEFAKKNTRLPVFLCQWQIHQACLFQQRRRQCIQGAYTRRFLPIVFHLPVYRSWRD